MLIVDGISFGLYFGVDREVIINIIYFCLSVFYIKLFLNILVWELYEGKI